MAGVTQAASSLTSTEKVGATKLPGIPGSTTQISVPSGVVTVQVCVATTSYILSRIV